METRLYKYEYNTMQIQCNTIQYYTSKQIQYALQYIVLKSRLDFKKKMNKSNVLA